MIACVRAAAAGTRKGYHTIARGSTDAGGSTRARPNGRRAQQRRHQRPRVGAIRRLLLPHGRAVGGHHALPQQQHGQPQQPVHEKQRAPAHSLDHERAHQQAQDRAAATGQRRAGGAPHATRPRRSAHFTAYGRACGSLRRFRRPPACGAQLARASPAVWSPTAAPPLGGARACAHQPSPATADSPSAPLERLGSARPRRAPSPSPTSARTAQNRGSDRPAAAACARRRAATRSPDRALAPI